ncbi:hypothetical protein [Microbulbifer halophilus]|uniref:hypothetical protein n=1 Tax=Microbulbifer halophilus TaxID=453963 RepID=UPI00361A47FD
MKNARPAKNQPSALNSANPIKLPSRLERLARAFSASVGGLSREAVDRATPCSNGPEYVRQLRRRLGVRIPCIRVPFITSDGISSRRGVYRPTDEDRTKLAKALNGARG